MPRKTKITAIPVEQEVANAVEGSTEPKTDAEKMTDVMKEVTVADEPPILTDDTPILTEEYVEPMPVAKPKAKRAPSKSPSVRKPKVVEPVVEVQPSLDEVQVVLTSKVADQGDVTLPGEEAKAAAKIECPDCGKLMSEKTLRYSHGPNCTVKKQRQAARDQEMQSVTNDIVEREVHKRLRARREERVARKEAMVAKLIKNAF